MPRLHALCRVALALTVVSGITSCGDEKSMGPAFGDAFEASISIAVAGSGLGTVVITARDAGNTDVSYFDFECRTADSACTRSHDIDVSGPVALRFVATADAGSVFAGWAGHCTTTADPTQATFTMEEESSFNCTATFTPVSSPGSLCTSFATAGDSYYLDSRWNPVEFLKDGSASQTPVQVTSGGNPIGTDFIFTADPAYRQLTTIVAPPGGTSGLSIIGTAYFKNDGGHNPSVDGAITKLIYWEDQLVSSNPGNLDVAWGIALRQGGTVYTKELGSFRTTPWQARGPIEVLASDFGSPGPNFTANGGPIEFGFFRRISSGTTPLATNTVVHGIDNWQVRICRN